MTVQYSIVLCDNCITSVLENHTRCRTVFHGFTCIEQGKTHSTLSTSQEGAHCFTGEYMVHHAQDPGQHTVPQMTQIYMHSHITHGSTGANKHLPPETGFLMHKTRETTWCHWRNTRFSCCTVLSRSDKNLPFINY